MPKSHLQQILHSTTLSRAELAQIIVDEMYQLVGILDANGINLESNQTSLAAAGLKREDVIGKYFWETPWWPEETRGILKTAVLKAAAGEFVRFEIENKVQNGSIFVDFSLKPVRDSNGKVKFIIPEGRDITARKRVEDELQRKNIELQSAYSLLKKQELELRAAHSASENALATSEERLQLATETAQLGFWDLNIETGRLFWDRTIMKMFEYDPNEFDETMDAFYCRLHPADLQMVKSQFESAIRDHSNFNAEYRITLPDGNLRYAVAKGRAIYSSSGQPTRMVGMVIEVTERKVAELALETRFRELAESMPQIVFTANAEGEPLYFNQNWFTYTGLVPGAEKDAWTSAIHPEDLPMVTSTWAEARVHCNPWELEYRVKSADGTYRWHLGRSVPSHDPKCVAIRWYGALTDIDDQKRSQLALSHAVRMRDEFLSIASHELKTPLTSLKLQTHMHQRKLARTEYSNENTRWAAKSVDTMDRQIERLTRLIEDMLDVSRIDSGKLSIHLEEFDLGEAVADSYAQIKPQFEAAQCQVSLILEPGVKGQWDHFRIEQVILNLFTNAIKYGAGKPVEIRVRAENDRAVLTVRDFGMGVSPENHARIFERFERAADMREISGLGLGLYITRHIVQMHGGTINVESEIGEGSTFKVELPLHGHSV
jgi:PAS domain S-box-containing protein